MEDMIAPRWVVTKGADGKEYVKDTKTDALTGPYRNAQGIANAWNKSLEVDA